MYISICVFRLMERFDFPAMKFTLYFMGYYKPESKPSSVTEMRQWLFNQPGCIELTQYGINLL